jgi:superfamily I DNA/RNA helicase
MTGGLRFFSMDSGVASGYDDSGFALSDFAVLCRVGRQMEAFEKAFQDHGIPVQKSDTEPFYRREPSRSVVAILKKAVRASHDGIRESGFGNREDRSKIRNADYGLQEEAGSTLRENVGEKTVRDTIEWIASKMPETGGSEHHQELERLSELAEPFGRDVNGFVKALSLGTGLDLFRPDIQSVALMTLHAAKGLEFSCVFIPGCEDGLLPYRLSGREEGDPEEERRLLYVGMTRAKRHLFLTHAGRRTLFGRALSLPRSPFLDAIEEELVERGESKFRKRKSGGDPQMDLF